MEPWHSLSVAETLKRTQSGRTGLSGREAALRLERDGRNVFCGRPKAPLYGFVS